MISARCCGPSVETAGVSALSVSGSALHAGSRVCNNSSRKSRGGLECLCDPGVGPDDTTVPNLSIPVTILNRGNPRPALEGPGKVAGLGEAQQVSDLTE